MGPVVGGVGTTDPEMFDGPGGLFVSTAKVPAFGNEFFEVEKFSRARPSWRMLFWHWVRRPASRAALTAGRSRPTRMPMMLITTSSSISVKPRRRRGRGLMKDPFLVERRELARFYRSPIMIDKG